ncbi:MAG TPA: hypothetical protein VLG69_02435 [Candidatus Andersenbacteria bacterium]|nr:hypothetical protein [Candidatus Andersenbacteria bacterium]
MARKLTVEEVQEKILRFGEDGVDDATLKREFNFAPEGELQAILDSGMTGDDYWLKRDENHWSLVDFAGMSRRYGLSNAQRLVGNKLLPASQKPESNELSLMDLSDLWTFVDRAEYAVECFQQAMRDPAHEVNRPYREWKQRFDNLDDSNKRLLSEKQQAVTDLATAKAEVARLTGELAKKPANAPVVDPAINNKAKSLDELLAIKPDLTAASLQVLLASCQDAAIVDKAKALVTIRPDLTPDLLKKILDENRNLKEDAENAAKKQKKMQKKAKKVAIARRKFRAIIALLGALLIGALSVYWYRHEINGYFSRSDETIAKQDKPEEQSSSSNEESEDPLDAAMRRLKAQKAEIQKSEKEGEEKK